jgi:hypothetical protein
MLFQAASGFYFRIVGGYINASLTSTNAVPRQIVLLVHPGKAAIRKFDDYARSQGIGALVIEQAWEEPWMRNLGSELHLHGTSPGGVTIYPMAPRLASQARLAGLAHRAHVAHIARQASPAPTAAVSLPSPSSSLIRQRPAVFGAYHATAGSQLAHGVDLW